MKDIRAEIDSGRVRIDPLGELMLSMDLFRRAWLVVQKPIRFRTTSRHARERSGRANSGVQNERPGIHRVQEDKDPGCLTVTSSLPGARGVSGVEGRPGCPARRSSVAAKAAVVSKGLSR
ncbi:hypothetical protein [Streptomyces nojiriensis]|uniref:hypothetical protein n=1 Tax=Streptomyces nojiriensis TaxID=66374 RepID=UPI0035DE41CC